MVHSKKTILSAVVLFFVSFVIFLFNVACEGMFPVPEPEPVNYTITASAGVYGSIEPEGKVVVSDGEKQAFTIIPDVGYKIDDVLINGDSIGVVEEYTFTDIKKDYTIEVKFKKKYTAPSTSPAPANYTIRVLATDGGTIEPEGSIELKKGSSQVFTITPLSPCYEIQEVLIDGISVGQPTTYTFDNIEKDYSIEVHFNLSDKKIHRYNQFGELQNEDYTSIQAAIDDAIDGDVIIVCPGRYSENLVFSGNKNITVQSIESENEDIVSDTIIDGGAEGSVAHFSNGDESTLQGFTITNGSGTSTGTYAAGGGIYINSSNPNIHYNIIEDNEAANGAGIFITGNSSPEIKENIIRNNESTVAAGGGIYAYGGSPKIIGNAITFNAAYTNGGGVQIYDSTPQISGNTISNNSAGKGGGLYVEDSYNTTTENSINSNIITKNTASSASGGIYLDNSMPTIGSNNNISENEAQWGGGIYMTSSIPKINENTILANNAIGISGSGGGIYMYSSSPHISNNTVNENAAGNCGGGIFIGDSYSVETDNNITGNSVESNSAKHGGGFYINNSNPLIIGENLINCNTAINGGGFNIEVSSSPTITNNRITKNIATGNGGGINIKDSNPEIGGVDENDTDNFNIICSNNPEQIKTNTGTSYPFNDFGYCVTLSVNHVDYGTVTGEGDYCEGNLVQIEAIPAEGYYFINWTDDKGNEISIENPYSFTMPAEDINLIANFEIN